MTINLEDGRALTVNPTLPIPVIQRSVYGHERIDQARFLLPKNVGLGDYFVEVAGGASVEYRTNEIVGVDR